MHTTNTTKRGAACGATTAAGSHAATGAPSLTRVPTRHRWQWVVLAVFLISAGALRPAPAEAAGWTSSCTWAGHFTIWPSTGWNGLFVRRSDVVFCREGHRVVYVYPTWAARTGGPNAAWAAAWVTRNELERFRFWTGFSPYQLQSLQEQAFCHGLFPYVWPFRASLETWSLESNRVAGVNAWTQVWNGCNW